jgi:hypothetical protein
MGHPAKGANDHVDDREGDERVMSDMWALVFFVVAYLFVGLVLLSYSLGGGIGQRKLKLVPVKSRSRKV